MKRFNFYARIIWKLDEYKKKFLNIVNHIERYAIMHTLYYLCISNILFK